MPSSTAQKLFGEALGTALLLATVIGSGIMAERLAGGLLAPYIVAQLAGAMLGAWLAHAMFDMTILQFSTKVRAGTGQWIAEAVATAGLLLVILRAPSSRVAAMVACYIGAAYWFTASTSFANPAAAFGRMFSESFAGIAPASAPGFVIAELVGAAIGVGIHSLLGGATATETVRDSN